MLPTVAICYCRSIPKKILYILFFSVPMSLSLQTNNLRVLVCPNRRPNTLPDVPIRTQETFMTWFYVDSVANNVWGYVTAPNYAAAYAAAATLTGIDWAGGLLVTPA